MDGWIGCLPAAGMNLKNWKLAGKTEKRSAVSSQGVAYVTESRLKASTWKARLDSIVGPCALHVPISVIPIPIYKTSTNISTGRCKLRQ